MGYSHNLRRLLKKINQVQCDVDESGMGPRRSKHAYRRASERQLVDRFDEVVTIEALRDVSRSLFVDGYYARAVEAAFKRLNYEVKSRSGLYETDGDGLMRKAFSANSPILYLNKFRTISEKDEQRGYMDLYAGVMTGIRNPRAHEHDLIDSPQTTLELLTLANHLMSKLENTRRISPENKTHRHAN